MGAQDARGYEAGFSLLDVKPHVARLLRQLGEFGFVPASEEAAAQPLPRIPLELCRVLEIQPDATDEEIFRAYRRIALAYHPDRNPSGEAANRFQQGAEAYRKIKSMRPELMKRMRTK